jgi:hypothetical protein
MRGLGGSKQQFCFVLLFSFFFHVAKVEMLHNKMEPKLATTNNNFEHPSLILTT